MMKRGVKRDENDPTSNSGALWIDKYRPRSISDLAVHSKKIQEVTNWINRQFGCNKSSILLLTGPSGCGKSATVRAIPDLDVVEWTDEAMDGDGGGSFADFLLKSSRYRTVQDQYGQENRRRKILLIENFPNQYYIDPSQLHYLLRRYKSVGKCPLIIIISDSQTVKYSSFSLIPKSLQIDLSIENISFNSIAASQMKKAITQIIKRENRKNLSEKQLQSIISEICTHSNGDIRSAINNLEIILTTTDSSLKSPDSIKDNPLFVFHALGKILYSKRYTDELEIEKFKQEHLKLNRNSLKTFRAPLLFTPEEVFDSCGLDHSTFINYLHENYLDFIEDIDQLATISEDFALSDFLYNRWSPDYSGLFGQYLTSVVTRSFIFHNESRPKNSWRPLRKSSLINLSRNISRIESEVLNDVFVDASDFVTLHNILSSKTIFVDVIPYGLKIIFKSSNPHLRQLRNKNVLKELQFSQRNAKVDNKLEDHMPIESFDNSNIFHCKKKGEEDLWNVCRVVNEDNVIIEIDD